MPEKSKQKVAFIINVVYAGVIILLCWLAFKAIDLVLPFLLALVLVALLNPLVRWLHRKLHINKKAVSIAVMALLYILAGLLIVLLATQIVVGLQGLITQLPDYYRDVIAPALTDAGNALDGWVGSLSSAWASNFAALQGSLSSALSQQVANLSSKGVSLLSSLLGGIPGFFITLVFTILLSFFISAQYDKVTGFIKGRLPQKAVEKYREVIGILKGSVFKYILAILKLMLCTFVELSIGFLISGVGNPIGKAAGIAIFDALPVFGTGGIMIPWVIIELLGQNYRLAGQLLILYVIVTVIRNIIEPKIVGDQLGLNPIVSLLSIYLGYKVMGVFGMILFPVLAQVLLTLYKNGTIRLHKEKQTDQGLESDEAEPG